MNLDDLKKPFPSGEIEWRIGRAGKKQDGSIWATAFAYVTNRAIMQRLDEVCGPGNWRNEFSSPPNAAIGTAALCTIYIRIDGEWVGKSDGADNSDMEATKGGLSDSMKRAAVQWGIGRYLYELEEGWVEVVDKKSNDSRYQPASDKKGVPAFYWIPPRLPEWALPKVGPANVPAGMTTGDKVPPPTVDKSPAGKKPAPLHMLKQARADFKKISHVTHAKAFCETVESWLANGQLTPTEAGDIAAAVAKNLPEWCGDDARDYEAADALILDMGKRMRIDDPTCIDLRCKLSDAKDSKLGAAA